MNYLDYEQMSINVLKTNNIDAICYFMEAAGSFINHRVQSFKYTHNDLTKDELIILLRMNGLNDDDMLVGGEVLRVVGDVESKSLILKTIEKIDLFHILHQIEWIINQRNN